MIDVQKHRAQVGSCFEVFRDQLSVAFELCGVSSAAVD